MSTEAEILRLQGRADHYREVAADAEGSARRFRKIAAEYEAQAAEMAAGLQLTIEVPS